MRNCRTVLLVPKKASLLHVCVGVKSVLVGTLAARAKTLHEISIGSPILIIAEDQRYIIEKRFTVIRLNY